MEMAAVAWCILNRVDSTETFFPDTIVEVVTQDSQFHGYSESNPVDPAYRMAGPGCSGSVVPGESRS